MDMILSQGEDHTVMSGMQIYLAAVQSQLCVCLLILSLNNGYLIAIVLFTLFSIWLNNFTMVFYSLASLFQHFLSDFVIYGNIGFKTLFFPCGTFSRIASVAKDRPMCKNISLKSENIFTLFYMPKVSLQQRRYSHTYFQVECHHGF